jgi:hypothetical protein
MAQRFMNVMLERRNSADLTHMIGTGNPSAEVMRRVDPAIVADAALFPQVRAFALIEPLRDCDRRHRRLPDRVWTGIGAR